MDICSNHLVEFVCKGGHEVKENLVFYEQLNNFMSHYH